MENIYKDIGSRIKAYRSTKGISQNALAEAIGYERTSIVNIESGTQKAPLDVLVKIAEVINVSTIVLLSGVIKDNNVIADENVMLTKKVCIYEEIIDKLLSNLESTQTAFEAIKNKLPS